MAPRSDGPLVLKLLNGVARAAELAWRGAGHALWLPPRAYFGVAQLLLHAEFLDPDRRVASRRAWARYALGVAGGSGMKLRPSLSGTCSARSTACGSRCA